MLERNDLLLVEILNDKLTTMIPKVSEHEVDNIKLIIKRKIDEVFGGNCKVKIIKSEDEPGMRVIFYIDYNCQIEAIFDNLHLVGKAGKLDVTKLANLVKEELKDVIVEQTVDINIVRDSGSDLRKFMLILEEFTKFAKLLNYDALYIKDTASSRLSLANKD